MNEVFHVRKERVQVVFDVLSCFGYVNVHVYLYGIAYTNQIHVPVLGPRVTIKNTLMFILY